jgi:hypothetical protein
MERKDDDHAAVKPEAEKPASSRPALKQARWPGLGGKSAIKNSTSVHSRMPTGRGSARGR